MRIDSSKTEPLLTRAIILLKGNENGAGGSICARVMDYYFCLFVCVFVLWAWFPPSATADDPCRFRCVCYIPTPLRVARMVLEATGSTYLDKARLSEEEGRCYPVYASVCAGLGRLSRSTFHPRVHPPHTHARAHTHTHTRAGGTYKLCVDMMKDADGFPVGAPPILIHGDRRICQTANVCAYVAGQAGLINTGLEPESMQVAMTIMDVASEVCLSD